MPDDTDLITLLAPHPTGWLAEQVGVCPSTVSNWRMGHHFPTPQHWPALARTLEIDMDNLVVMVKRAREDRHPIEFVSVASRIADLSPDARKMVMAALRAAEAIRNLET